MRAVRRIVSAGVRQPQIQRRLLTQCNLSRRPHIRSYPDSPACTKLQELSARPSAVATQHRFYHQSGTNNANPLTNLDKTILSTNTAASKVAIPIDGDSHEFSAILLRDLCECPACVHESSRQKLYSTAEIPPSIQARSVTPSSAKADAFDINWDKDAPGFDSDHVTTINVDTLRGINTSGAAPGPFHASLAPPTSWDSRNTIPDFDYNLYMQDDAELFKVIQQLHTHGLVFITGVPGIEKSVSTIAERMGPVKDTFYGYTWDVRTVPQAINAAYTSSNLDFHTDLLYFQSPPHIQLLHCIQSSSSGGASVFSDAFKSAVDLYETDLDAFNVLATLPVNYHYKHPDSNLYTATKPVFDMRPLRVGDVTYSNLPEFLEAWEHNRQKVNRSTGAELPRLTVLDCLEKINWGPPFMAPFTLQNDSMEQARSNALSPRECLNHKIDEWHSAARKFSALLHRDDVLHERLMKPGECVLFNNTRVLHSRRAFDSGDVGKARWLRGTYVDKDPFFSKLRVLRHKFGDASGSVAMESAASL